MRWWGLVIAAFVGLGACSSEDGDRDLARSTTGPGVEIHCANLKTQHNLERFPRAIGDTTVEVACQGAQ